MLNFCEPDDATVLWNEHLKTFLCDADVFDITPLMFSAAAIRDDGGYDICIAPNPRLTYARLQAQIDSGTFPAKDSRRERSIEETTTLDDEAIDLYGDLVDFVKRHKRGIGLLDKFFVDHDAILARQARGASLATVGNRDAWERETVPNVSLT